MGERIKIRTTFTDSRRRMTPEELELLQGKVSANPGNMELLDWAAFAYYCRGQLPAAAGLYRQLIEHAPANASYHYYLAGALSRGGDLPGASDHWRRVMELDVDGRFAQRASSKLLALSPSPGGPVTVPVAAPIPVPIPVP